MTGLTWAELVRTTAAGLIGGGGVQVEVEARWLVERASGLDAAEVAGVADQPPTRRAVAEVAAMVQRRVAGEPLQYVLGVWAFRELDLLVDRRVLIPRPETEVVAEIAIETAVRLGARRAHPDPWAGGATRYAVADLGTGSGALALALAGELADAEVWATDASDGALAVARANFAGAGLPATRIRVASGSWFEALPETLRGALHLIVTNPPYVSEAEYAALPDVVAGWEPRRALVSGPTGREAIDHIVSHAPEWLEPGGALVCEMAPHQIEASTELAERSGFIDIETMRDLAGRERVIVARWTG
ncbi:MAG TPA: peptide chain release factor N(5)-glutamine methyltransferase [Acidimicrobiia bacterium]|nr:peptide chain release factor N(5)-glutamine methyltransferase [Acidimicrobiia bacterium]